MKTHVSSDETDILTFIQENRKSIAANESSIDYLMCEQAFVRKTAPVSEFRTIKLQKLADAARNYREMNRVLKRANIAAAKLL